MFEANSHRFRLNSSVESTGPLSRQPAIHFASSPIYLLVVKLVPTSNFEAVTVTMMIRLPDTGSTIEPIFEGRLSSSFRAVNRV